MHPVLVLFALAVAVVLGGAPVGSQSADTCSCGDAPLVELVESADAVFVGSAIRVNSTVDGPAGLEELWDFRVDVVYRGPEEEEVIAVGGGGELSNCRAEFEPGVSVGIVARWRSGHLATGLCDVVDANAMVAALGEGRPPVSSGGPGATAWIVALGVVVSAAALAVGWRLVQSRRAPQ